MKKLIEIFSCIRCLIKKNFFIIEKNDKYHECKKVLGITENLNSEIPEKEIEEVLNRYRNMTRWQTV